MGKLFGIIVGLFGYVPETNVAEERSKVEKLTSDVARLTAALDGMRAERDELQKQLLASMSGKDALASVT